MIKQHINFKLSFLFSLFSIAFFGQNKVMDYNKNMTDFEFEAKRKLKKEFITNENPENKIQIIAKITNDTIISIYLKNNSKDSLKLRMQDSHMYVIQEAKNKLGEWKPIEYWHYSWCGNSYYTESIASQKIIKTDTEKYNGTFETEIRFKFLINNEIHYSNTLKSKIDLTQFEIPKALDEDHRYRSVNNVADEVLAEKVVFLEPNAQMEFYKKMNEQREKRIEQNNKSKESQKKETESEEK